MNRPVRPTAFLQASRASDNRNNVAWAAFDTYRVTHGLATQAQLLHREVGGFQSSRRAPLLAEAQR
jgi:hypothetical protein